MYTTSATPIRLPGPLRPSTRADHIARGLGPSAHELRMPVSAKLRAERGHTVLALYNASKGAALAPPVRAVSQIPKLRIVTFVFSVRVGILMVREVLAIWPPGLHLGFQFWPQLVDHVDRVRVVKPFELRLHPFLARQQQTWLEFVPRAHALQAYYRFVFLSQGFKQSRHACNSAHLLPHLFARLLSLGFRKLLLSRVHNAR
mmetsp:Transcript_98057/g.277328  ORF Transcript_98057/g.277328 Transcript_98057/m.277328 type:complete len:202 (-) Transcript_98057:1221-1826(-)